MIDSILPSYSRANLRFVKGEGVWLFTENGEKYLDMGAGIAVNCLGHANPHLTKVLTDQASQLWHTSNLYHIPNQEKLAKNLFNPPLQILFFLQILELKVWNVQ